MVKTTGKTAPAPASSAPTRDRNSMVENMGENSCWIHGGAIYTSTARSIMAVLGTCENQVLRGRNFLTCCCTQHVTTRQMVMEVSQNPCSVGLHPFNNRPALRSHFIGCSCELSKILFNSFWKYNGGGSSFSKAGFTWGVGGHGIWITD